ncbi:hypothetical protein A9K55_000262 [Cordyceps militaris]|uniref:Uncharacterized protein n=1 Tax=Cordyceps militaris TaxID=73501 RepID=A0A2H4SW78_CORMI|nr:hypothetical protein A9K55_000262 [Cordyceps militaris]
MTPGKSHELNSHRMTSVKCQLSALASQLPAATHLTLLDQQTAQANPSAASLKHPSVLCCIVLESKSAVVFNSIPSEVLLYRDDAIMTFADDESLEMRELIKTRLRNIRGFCFLDGKPMTGREKRDNGIIDALHSEAPSGPVAAERCLTHLMLASNCLWEVLVTRGPDEFWNSVGQEKGGKMPLSITRDLVLAFVRARDRYLRCFPHKSPHAVNNMLEAYTQYLLEKFQALGKVMILGSPVNWCLSAKEVQDVEALTPQGPAKQVSRNKFELSSSARNLLVPARSLSPIGKFKHNLMGLAEEIMQQYPGQRELLPQ